MSDLLAEDAPGARSAIDGGIVAAAIALFRRKPLHHVTLEQVAAEAGTTDAVVRDRFPTIDHLVLEVVQTWNAQRTGPLVPIAERHGAVAFLRSIVLANAADPALMRLMSSTAAVAATADLPTAHALQTAWIRFHALVQRALTHDIAVGREPATMEPARGAEQLIAMYEGLQLQSMMRPHMDVAEAFDRAMTRLRDGWSRSYIPPVWDL